MKPKAPGWGLFPSQYGCDPYNTVDQHELGQHVVRAYYGPLTAVAYRDARAWDFAPGVCSAAKLASWQEASLNPHLMRRQAG